MKLSKIARSIAKRVFWREHLNYSSNEIRTLNQMLPTIEMKMVLPLLFRGKGYFESFDLRQNMTELLALIEQLKHCELKTICEIGTYRGGTLFVWCQLAAADAHIINVDYTTRYFGSDSYDRGELFFRSFCRHGQVLECVRGDSRSQSTRERVERSLGGRKLDFLFIDGDHSYDAVEQDYLNYSPFVRKGGLIALHDIVRRHDRPNSEVWRFWNSLKDREKSAIEFIDNVTDQKKLGIGVITKD